MTDKKENNDENQKPWFGFVMILASFQVFWLDFFKTDWDLFLFSFLTVLLLILQIIMASMLYIASKKLEMSELQAGNMIDYLSKKKPSEKLLDTFVFAGLFAIPASAQYWDIAITWAFIFMLKQIMWLPIQKRVREELNNSDK